MDETREVSGRLIVVPAYTASLDAAATLMPEGWWIEYMRQSNSPGTYRRFVIIIRNIENYDEDTDEGMLEATAVHAFEAIARCIAAIRARGEG
jgi:hypothetical protein